MRKKYISSFVHVRSFTMSDNSKCKFSFFFFHLILMNNSVCKAETIQTTDDKCEKESSSSLTTNVNTSTPVRLFGQFKTSGISGFGSFGQSSSNGQSSSTSLFTNTLSKLSSTNGIGSGGFGSISTNGTSGFGSSSTSLAASLAPLTSNKTLFGETNSTTKSKENAEDEENDEDENDNDEANTSAPSLFETAAEYEAKRASTHPIANIQGDTSTGEEHEVTKFQVCSKIRSSRNQSISFHSF